LTSALERGEWSVSRPFKANFISGNSHKSLGAKSGKKGGYYISVIDFWVRNCDTERLMSCSIVMVENPIVGSEFRPFSMHNFK